MKKEERPIFRETFTIERFIKIFLIHRLSGFSPFMGDNDLETMANVTSIEWDFDDDSFDVISEEAKNFIEKLLIKNME